MNLGRPLENNAFSPSGISIPPFKFGGKTFKQLKFIMIKVTGSLSLIRRPVGQLYSDATQNSTGNHNSCKASGDIMFIIRCKFLKEKWCWMSSKGDLFFFIYEDNRTFLYHEVESIRTALHDKTTSSAN